MSPYRRTKRELLTVVNQEFQLPNIFDVVRGFQQFFNQGKKKGEAFSAIQIKILK